MVTIGNASADAEGPQAPSWSHRFVDAFNRWRLLPDARLLHLAGTGSKFDDLGSPGAVMNAAAFVTWPGTPRAAFERESFVETAALAVRLLDDVLLVCDSVPAGTQPRLGLIGVADALQMLNLPYEGASDMASALAEGALLGATDLARERGPADCDRQQLAERWRNVGAPERLVDAVLRWGMRHSRLTAIEPQPQLAAMQPWIDAPIDYPLVCSVAPDPAAIERSGRVACKQGLQPLTLRRARALQLINNEVDGKA